MSHLENHTQAFVNVKGSVMTTAIFVEHNDKLIETIANLNGWIAIDCCIYGEPLHGQFWNGMEFADSIPLEPIVNPIAEFPVN